MFNPKRKKRCNQLIYNALVNLSVVPQELHKYIYEHTETHEKQYRPYL